MRILMTISILLLNVYLSDQQKSNTDAWHYKFAYTKSLNSQFNIECESNDQIWIGWSHYGTRGKPVDSPTASFNKNSHLLTL
jgi:hypothetical protein